jgi:S1-C subfamily serine protease
VSILLKEPSDFTRLRPRDGSHGAVDAALVVRGGDERALYRAEVCVNIDSHARAKFVAESIAAALFRDHVGPGKERVRREKERSHASAAAAGSRRVLGLVLGPLPDQMKPLAGPGHVGGAAVILRIVPGSPAFLAGLKEGDVLIRVDGVALDAEEPAASVRRAASAVPPREVRMTVRRAPAGRLIDAALPVVAG